MLKVGFDKEKNQWTLYNFATNGILYFETKQDLEDYLDAHSG